MSEKEMIPAEETEVFWAGWDEWRRSHPEIPSRERWDRWLAEWKRQHENEEQDAR